MIFDLAQLELGPTWEEAPPGHRFTLRSPGTEAGAKLTGITVYELEPGQGTWPYHFELSEEEWLLVIAGEVVVRTPEGERTLRAGDITCFPAGPAGAHAVRNDSSAVARYAMPSSRAPYGDGAVYVDSKKFVIHAPGDFHHRGWLGEEVPYWQETP